MYFFHTKYMDFRRTPRNVLSGKALDYRYNYYCNYPLITHKRQVNLKVMSKLIKTKV